MSIFNEVFEQCYTTLAGVRDNRARADSERRRYNRALLALRCQNYFLSCTFENESGAAGITGQDRTLAIERPLIVRGGGMNAIFIGGTGVDFDVPDGGSVNLQILRSGSSRAQVSKESIRSSHYLSNGEAQPFALEWPMPWVLDKNEIIHVFFTQVSACTAGTIYGVGFYGVAVDDQLRCDEALPDSIREQIRACNIQKPRYVHLKTDNGGGTIVLPGIGADERTVANTIEVSEHTLVLGWRRWQIGMNTDTGAAPSTTIRLVVTGGKAFSRIEIPAKAFEYMARPTEGYFRFSVPHFIPKGSSLSLSITSTIEQIQQQMEGEVELLCVSV